MDVSIVLTSTPTEIWVCSRIAAVLWVLERPKPTPRRTSPNCLGRERML